LTALRRAEYPSPVITPADAATDNLRLSLSGYAIAQPYPKTCVALNAGRSQPEIELRLDKGQQISVKHAVVRLVPAVGPAEPAFPLLLDGRSGAASTVAIRDGTAFRVQSEFVAPTGGRACAPPSAFTRNPDAPTFCSTVVDIQEFLARLPFEDGRLLRPQTVRRIQDRLVPLLGKAEHSAPADVATPVEAFSREVRTSLFYGQHPSGQPAVIDAERTITQFMLNNCG
jgi:hypothetical protein